MGRECPPCPELHQELPMPARVRREINHSNKNVSGHLASEFHHLPPSKAGPARRKALGARLSAGVGARAGRGQPRHAHQLKTKPRDSCGHLLSPAHGGSPLSRRVSSALPRRALPPVRGLSSIVLCLGTKGSPPLKKPHCLLGRLGKRGSLLELRGGAESTLKPKLKMYL